MPRIATRHTHIIAYRQRFSLGVRMLGCLVLLAGTIVMAAAVVELAKGLMSQAVWLMASLGCLLVACGALLFCGERGKLFDREARTVTFWWGVVWPLWRTIHDLQPYPAIGVEPHDEAGLARWRVSLWKTGAERLELFDVASQQVAEGAARQVAAFLSLVIAPPPASPPPALTAAAENTTASAGPQEGRWTRS